MDAFVIHGGGPLSGDIRVNGAKNSALKLVAAALLAPGRTVIDNVPDIADIRVMSEVMVWLGVDVERDGGTLTLDVPELVGDSTPAHLVKQLRAAIVVLGPLLARGGHAHVATPGGCNLGNRAIDLHLSGLAQMGAEISFGPEHVEARAATLNGADIELPYPSVGATENILMAAVRAKGTTRIVNAAREPEIADIVRFLTGMGADIEGEGTDELVIHGVSELHPTKHTVVGDRIEAGTYAVAAAVTGGTINIEGVVPDHLRMALDKMTEMGVSISEREHGMTVSGGGALHGVDIVTFPFPGFPTDLQPQFLLLLSQARGTSMLTENVFDGRFSIVNELCRLGADIDLEGHHAVVRGPHPLRGAEVRATDLRAGAALVLAGLVAEGETTVLDPYHVDRGYADFTGSLRRLGGDVQRITIGEALAG